MKLKLHTVVCSVKSMCCIKSKCNVCFDNLLGKRVGANSGDKAPGRIKDYTVYIYKSEHGEPKKNVRVSKFGTREVLVQKLAETIKSTWITPKRRWIKVKWSSILSDLGYLLSQWEDELRLVFSCPWVLPLHQLESCRCHSQMIRRTSMQRTRSVKWEIA